jgi:hypothetical protein
VSWKRRLFYTGLAVWFGGLLATFYLVWRYKMSPGPLAEAPETWPEASAVRWSPDVANIVMFAHPQCPCTRASLVELARLADEVRARAKVHVVIIHPDDTPIDFIEGEIANRTAALPNADVIIDHGGKEAERFGAVVSGSTVVYSRDGKLVFRGGLTTARGHEGRGPAHDRILAAIVAAPVDRHDAPTFGCSLRESDRPISTDHTP